MTKKRKRSNKIDFGIKAMMIVFFSFFFKTFFVKMFFSRPSYSPIKIVETDPSKLADIRRKLAVERNRLPIASAKQQLIEEFENNETLVIVGETGSGKSTQVKTIV